MKTKNDERKYPVLCAWCLEKGRETIVNWSEVANSHGICEECSAVLRLECERIRVRNKLVRRRKPGARSQKISGYNVARRPECRGLG